MAIEIRVPTLGESVTEATSADGSRKPATRSRRDEPLVELETDKVTLEVNAPATGVLTEIVVEGRRHGDARRAARPDRRGAPAQPPRPQPRAKPNRLPAPPRPPRRRRRHRRRPRCRRRPPPRKIAADDGLDLAGVEAPASAARC